MKSRDEYQVDAILVLLAGVGILLVLVAWLAGCAAGYEPHPSDAPEGIVPWHCDCHAAEREHGDLCLTEEEVREYEVDWQCVCSQRFGDCRDAG